MSYAPDNDLQRALDKLTVQEVWRRAGLPDCPREGNVVVKSPFREDRKGKSFSICFRGRGFKEHASGETGNVWKFAELALGKGGKELADILIEWSGIVRTPRIRDAAVKAAAKAGSGKAEDVVAELPPEVRRAIKRQEKAREMAEAEERLREDRARLLAPKMAVRELHEWSPIVRARFLEGWREMGRHERQAEWAEARGWPAGWIEWLRESGLVSMPWLPWCEPGEKWAKRGKAFRVDAPRWDADGNFAGLRHIGYHQQFWTEEGKAWTYAPYLPESEAKARTEFQRQMCAVELERGGEWGGEARVPGLPFVLPGRVGAPVRLVVLAEGQWDAITFAGACGWLNIDYPWPAGVWVFGLRGSNGVEPLLAWWRLLFLEHRPSVLVLADNDAAGMRWTEPEKPKVLGAVPPPTFGEKLRACGASRVEVTRVRPQHGKDFNDYFRAKTPGPLDMARWLSGLGLSVAA